MARQSGEGESPSGSSSRRDPPRRRGEELIVGRLAGHGAAPYQYRGEEGPSYFVKLLTSEGPRTLWGKDLERAMKEAETQPKAGDLIGARRKSREAVTFTERVKDPQGNVISTIDHQAHRSIWVVEKVAYFAERSRLAKKVREDQTYDKETIKKHPELRSSFLSIRAAEEFAEHKIKSPEDRVKFLELIRMVLSDSIREGAPLPNVRLKDKAPVVSIRRKPEEPTR